MKPSHWNTFNDILNLNPKDHNDLSKVYMTSFDVTFKNFGQIFNMSNMFEKTLPKRAANNQLKAEIIASKYNCRTSYRAIYTTKDNFESLKKVREKLAELMLVTPIFWTPMRKGDFGNFKTFAFGFFPYANKVDSKDISSSDINLSLYHEENKLIFRYNNNEPTKQLSNIINQRKKLFETGEHPSAISFSLNDDDELAYLINKIEPSETEDISIYSDISSPEEYFMRIISDNDAEDFVIPNYKLLFIKTKTETEYDGNVDYETENKMKRVINLLSRKIALSDVSTIIYNSCFCYCCGYDDTKFDKNFQHINFFNSYFSF